MPLILEDDKMCFACGSKNTKGLRLKFTHPQPGKLLSTVVFTKHHQGYKNIVHGGMMATVLDEIMVNLAWIEGKPAVTAQLNVSLKKAAKVGENIHLEGRLVKEKARTLYTRSEAKNDQGEVLATAEGVCVKIRIKNGSASLTTILSKAPL